MKTEANAALHLYRSIVRTRYPVLSRIELRQQGNEFEDYPRLMLECELRPANPNQPGHLRLTFFGVRDAVIRPRVELMSSVVVDITEIDDRQWEGCYLKGARQVFA